MDKTNPHVVIVEDEVIIALDLKQSLEEFGYVVDEIYANTTEAMEGIEEHKPDVVLMDIILEGADEGTHIVEHIQEKLGIPVIYVTSHSDDKALQKARVTKPFGYVIKPVDEHQLHGTIQIALFKSNHELRPSTRMIDKDDCVRLANGYMYNLISHQLLQNGTPVILTRKEKQLVQFLVEHMNTTMTYDAIAKKIWNGRPVNTATLRSLVRRIREKIGDEVIENITSIGYRISVKSSSKN